MGRQIGRQGKPNLWGVVPKIIEMQSEGGAAGAPARALTSGRWATSPPARGLLLFVPNLYKMAGELTPFVLHVAARALATRPVDLRRPLRRDGLPGHRLRAAGQQLGAGGPGHGADRPGRHPGRAHPVIHFFDGFRTSHEVAKIVAVEPDTVRAMIDDTLVAAHRARAPVARAPGAARHGPEPGRVLPVAARQPPYYDAFPAIVREAMDRFGALTGRHYRLFDYVGRPDAEQVIVVMGSAAETVGETVEHLCARREGRPAQAAPVPPLCRRGAAGAIPPPPRPSPCSTAARSPAPTASRSKRTCSPPSPKPPPTAAAPMPRITGGRYGPGQQRSSPGMVKAVFDELAADKPKRGFTVGIVDDITHLSLPWDAGFRSDASRACLRGVLGPRRRRHRCRPTRTRSRSSANPPRSRPRATSL